MTSWSKLCELLHQICVAPPFSCFFRPLTNSIYDPLTAVARSDQKTTQPDDTACTDTFFRYLRVRYEDIATSPELAAALIYCWSGLGPVPASVSEWIDVNTKMPTCDDGAHRTRYLSANIEGSSFSYLYAATPEHPSIGSDDVEAFVRADQRALGAPQSGASDAGAGSGDSRRNNNESGNNLTKCLANTKEANDNPYGTKRHSAVMVSMWRTLLPREDAQAVWEACEDSGIMSTLHYEP